jgi:hypothetical protein
MNYSPKQAPWPGWLFYASTNFGPTNNFWRDFPALNTYITRCQSFLQDGLPDNDILLYFPIYDLWHNSGVLLNQFSVHNINKWLYGTPFHDAAALMWQRRFTFDYISDRLLKEITVNSKKLLTGKVKYKTLVVPKSKLMPNGTLEKTIDLAKNGATIIVLDGLPEDVPGYGDLEARRRNQKSLIDGLEFSETQFHNMRRANIGKGAVVTGHISRCGFIISLPDPLCC